MANNKIKTEDISERFDMPDMDAFEELKQYCDEHNVKLIAISKTKPEAAIREIYDSGHKLFGENKVQELTGKQSSLPADIQWHMVGHVQRNKVKYLVPFVAMIESVDSLRLLKEINKRARKEERVIDCLLQMHIAGESTKFGLDETELKELLESESVAKMENVRICGLMGMATLTDDKKQIAREFRGLRKLFDEIKGHYFAKAAHFADVSMGMTNDYEIAVAAGSTMIRVGSKIFGPRH